MCVCRSERVLQLQGDGTLRAPAQHVRGDPDGELLWLHHVRMCPRSFRRVRSRTWPLQATSDGLAFSGKSLLDALSGPHSRIADVTCLLCLQFKRQLIKAEAALKVYEKATTGEMLSL